MPLPVIDAERETKFTAGPWRVEGPADFPNPNMGMWEVEGATNICTHCTLYDARLIAAAPDLYRCLEGLSRAYAALDRDGTYTASDGSWYAHSVAALAKARTGAPE